MKDTTAAAIEQAFQKYGNMTIVQAVQRTGFPQPRIRRHIKEPKYTQAGTIRTGRNPETVWKLNP